MSEKRLNCHNCGAELLGEYCHACGQRHLPHGLTWQEIRQEFIEKVLNIESGLGLTLAKLTTAPGQMVHEYLHGARRRYTSPLQYFLLCTALYFLVANYAGILDVEKIVGASDKQELAPAMHVMAAIMDNMKWLTYLGVPVYAAFYWLVFKKAGFSYVEVLVSQTYYAAQGALLQLPFLFLAKWQGFWIVEFSALFTVIYSVWTVRQFFHASWLKSIGLMLLIYLLLMLPGMIMGMAYAFLSS